MAAKLERRRDRRFRYEKAATLVRGRTCSMVVTSDVGFRGVRLRTDAPPPLRELLVVRLQLPPDGEALELFGMPVWAVRGAGDGRDDGVGVEFFAVPVESQRRWNEFVRRIARASPEPELEVTTPGELEGRESRRLHERVVVELRVLVRTPAGSRMATTHYVSRRGAFLKASLKVKVGTRLELELIHPATGEPLPLQAIVRHRGERATRAGIGVEFVGLDERRAERLREWVLAALDASGPPGDGSPPERVAPREPVEVDFFAGLDLEV